MKARRRDASFSPQHPRRKRKYPNVRLFALLTGRLRQGPAAAHRTSFDAPSDADRYFPPTCVHLRLPHCCDKSRHQRGDTFHDIIYATFPTVRQFLIRAVNLHLAPSRRTRIHERLQQHAPVAQILIEHSSL